MKLPVLPFCRHKCHSAGANVTSLICESQLHDNRRSFLYTAQTKVPFVVEPDLDFRQVFSDLKALKAQLNLRAERFALRFLLSNYIETMKESYYNGFVPLYQKMQDLRQSNAGESAPDVEQMLETKRALREYRTLVLDCLALPNILHHQWVPAGQQDFYPCVDDASKRLRIEHADFLIERRLLVHRLDPPSIYLLGPAAEYVRRLGQFLTRKFDHLSYTAFSAPHFVRSAILEAYGLETCGVESLKLAPSIERSAEEADLVDFVIPHVVGNCPLPFLALFTAKTFSAMEFPLKFYSLSAAYTRERIISQPDDPQPLLDSSQRPILSLFILATGSESIEKSASELSAVIDSTMRSNFRLPVMQCLVASKNLPAVEQWRRNVCVQLKRSQRPVPVARIAGFGDFLSRRLRTYDASGRYVHMIYAEVDLFRVLAAALEHNFVSGADVWQCLTSHFAT